MNEIRKKRYIGAALKALSNLIKREVDKHALKSDVALTGMQSWFIGYLNSCQDTKDVFQKDLEAEFNIRRSTATGILKLMEKNGLITREPVNYDARLKKILLTPKAKEICLNIKQHIIQIENKLAKGLTQEQIDTFFAIVDKLKENLEESADF
jgi:MarR family transcriptional regulator, repressor for mepA